MKRLMRAPYRLLLSVIFSAFWVTQPIAGQAFSVERSSYDWFLNESEQVLVKISPSVVGREEYLELSLVRLDFSEGTDVPRIWPLDEELVTIFSLDKSEISLSEEATVKIAGGELRLEGRGLVLGLRMVKKPISGGLTAEQGIIVPIFLRGRIQDVNLEVESLKIPWIQWSEFEGMVDIRNKGEDTVVPVGKILYKNLLFGERIEVEFNPTKRRLPPGVKREFSLEANLGWGLWRVILNEAGAGRSQIFLVVRPEFLGGAALLIAILTGLAMRHVFKRWRI